MFGLIMPLNDYIYARSHLYFNIRDAQFKSRHISIQKNAIGAHTHGIKKECEQGQENSSYTLLTLLLTTLIYLINHFQFLRTSTRCCFYDHRV